jgi:hypothetical protein
VRFTLVLEVAGPAQRIDDPSEFWPETLERLVVGELVLTDWLGDGLEKCQFNPAEPPAGIDWHRDDRVLTTRGRVYRLAGRH